MAKFKNGQNLAPVSVPCYDWKGDNGEASRKTVIISPIRIIENGDGTVQISWGCSRGAFCKDKGCRYSHAAEESEYAKKGSIDF